MAIDYQERIPNNVDLASNRTLQRALELSKREKEREEQAGYSPKGAGFDPPADCAGGVSHCRRALRRWRPR